MTIYHNKIHEDFSDISYLMEVKDNVRPIRNHKSVCPVLQTLYFIFFNLFKHLPKMDNHTIS